MDENERELYARIIAHAGGTSTARTATAATHSLQIIFYGMACFDPLPSGGGYRVLFPNALDGSGDLPVHTAGIWVRSRSELATTKWPWLGWRNDFFVGDPGQKITVSGLEATPLVATGFEDALINFKDCDPTFEISSTPDAVMELTVDCGELTVHPVGTKGMTVVLWTVQIADGAPVRFNLGNAFVEAGPNTTQVMLTNVAASPADAEVPPHFRIYWKLATDPNAAITEAYPPVPTTKAEITLDDDTFKYSLMTPDRLCSPGYSGKTLTAARTTRTSRAASPDERR